MPSPRLSASRVPPTAITSPSARMTRLWRRRGKFIGLVRLHAGEAAVISMIAALLIAGSPPPERRILPGAYIADDSAWPLLPNELVGPFVQAAFGLFGSSR